MQSHRPVKFLAFGSLIRVQRGPLSASNVIRYSDNLGVIPEYSRDEGD